MDTSTSGSDHAVVVTGGSGCLGQHLIKLLQTKADDVTEIRVLDQVPYQNKLGHRETKRVVSTCGDITDSDTVRQILKGAKSVFHLASIISVTNFPDIDAMEKINVNGTRKVIDACLTENVECLVYCSTVETAIGVEDVIDGSENDVTPPKVFFHDGYARTKLKAENMVLEANGCQLDTGGTLKTAVVRPSQFYGELDRHYITSIMKLAKKTGGILIPIGSKKSLHQHVYVGNNAWAFICAEKALRTNPNASGEAYFITDDTPVADMYSQTAPFIEEKGMRLSSFRIPYWLIYTLIFVLEIILLLLSPIIKVDLGFTRRALSFANATILLKRDKAQSLLNYIPLFSVEESMRNSRSYYRDVPI